MESFYDNLRWQDIVDILLLALIFYRILILVKGTRTMRMLVGFSVLIVLYLLSRFLELEALGMMLDNIANSLVLVLVILFQSDIRNALAQFGLISFFSGGGNPKKDIIDEIIQTAIIMSQRRIGALIVFEREVGLRNFMEKGKVINGLVSQELLLSIFHPTSPLHDGAVILDSKGNLISARCLLPISTSSHISPILGTRHRAAIGLSEETDAIILIVSEERSEISLCYKGEILRGSGHPNIKQILFELLDGIRPNLTEVIKSTQTQSENFEEEDVLGKTSIASTV